MQNLTNYFIFLGFEPQHNVFRLLIVIVVLRIAHEHEYAATVRGTAMTISVCIFQDLPLDLYGTAFHWWHQTTCASLLAFAICSFSFALDLILFCASAECFIPCICVIKCKFRFFSLLKIVCVAISQVCASCRQVLNVYCKISKVLN